MRIGVLVSGRGTNLAALLAAEAAGELAPAELACVISNRPGAGALALAEAAGKPAIVVDHKAFAGREAFEDALLEVIEAHQVEAVVLAGFLRVLTPRFLSRFADRVLNIHPSLLPAFPGVSAQTQAFAHGVKVAGCTVHLVTAELDAGPIISQAAVSVGEDEDEAKLRARILAKEHELLPRAVQLLAAGRLVREGRKVRIAPGPGSRPGPGPEGPAPGTRRGRAA